MNYCSHLDLSLYMLPLVYVIRGHSTAFSLSYISFNHSKNLKVSALNDCIQDIKFCMAQSFLHLNMDKTELMVINSHFSFSSLVIC